MVFSWLEGVLVLGAGMVMVSLLAAVVVLVLVLSRRNRSDRQRTERISRELERINAMATAGRISAEEAGELRLALQEQRPVADGWSVGPGRLQKSRNVVLCGVCGGLAEWLRWDATLFRLGYALATLFIGGFPGIIAYIILAIVMPAAEGARRSGSKVAGLILLLLVLPLLCLGLLALCVFGTRATHTFHGIPSIQRLH